MSEITVLTWGIWDFLHAGHVRLLRKARDMGDRLVVGINSDRIVKMIRKSTWRPVFNQTERVYILKALRDVDEVIVFDELTANRLIEEIRPKICAKGTHDLPSGERAAMQKVGSRFVPIKPLSSHPHTTEIIEKVCLNLLAEQMARSDPKLYFPAIPLDKLCPVKYPQQ